MSLRLYKLQFRHAHFGDGLLSDSIANFDASRLYSALFLEALKLDCEDEFLALTQQTDFVLSDAFPYIDGQPYLPKPIGYPEYEESTLQDLKKVRQETKKVKKLHYLPYQQFSAYLQKKVDIDTLLANQSRLSKISYVTQKGVDPFQVGVTAFQEALYVLADQSALFDLLMESLQYTGLGGKRSSGFGQFYLETHTVPEDLASHLTIQTNAACMLLTSALPKDAELAGSLEQANYLLKKASGFAYSDSSGELLRKQDLYKFKAGSTFKKSFTGEIRDIRPDEFPHSVWHFAKGLFYQL